MAIDWTKLFEDYKGKWVALLEDEVTVVGSGATALEALAEAKREGYDNPVLSRMPQELTAYVGAGL
ncbi:MAG: hypothetical protein UY95_C0033G0003 [Parcubacteria group bacterium GW2011_GWA2_56_7]|nr:MAG: hypothetical protein UY95_C0033G0003 [Parcubacteria group bacterium GW2011_GWA2_56_7]